MAILSSRWNITFNPQEKEDQKVQQEEFFRKQIEMQQQPLDIGTFQLYDPDEKKVAQEILAEGWDEQAVRERVQQLNRFRANTWGDYNKAHAMGLFDETDFEGVRMYEENQNFLQEQQAREEQRLMIEQKEQQSNIDKFLESTWDLLYGARRRKELRTDLRQRQIEAWLVDKYSARGFVNNWDNFWAWAPGIVWDLIGLFVNIEDPTESQNRITADDTLIMLWNLLLGLGSNVVEGTTWGKVMLFQEQNEMADEVGQALKEFFTKENMTELAYTDPIGFSLEALFIAAGVKKAGIKSMEKYKSISANRAAKAKYGKDAAELLAYERAISKLQEVQKTNWKPSHTPEQFGKLIEKQTEELNWILKNMGVTAKVDPSDFYDAAQFRDFLHASNKLLKDGTPLSQKAFNKMSLTEMWTSFAQNLSRVWEELGRIRTNKTLSTEDLNMLRQLDEPLDQLVASARAGKLAEGDVQKIVSAMTKVRNIDGATPTAADVMSLINVYNRVFPSQRGELPNVNIENIRRDLNWVIRNSLNPEEYAKFMSLSGEYRALTNGQHFIKKYSGFLEEDFLSKMSAAAFRGRSISASVWAIVASLGLGVAFGSVAVWGLWLGATLWTTWKLAKRYSKRQLIGAALTDTKIRNIESLRDAGVISDFVSDMKNATAFLKTEAGTSHFNALRAALQSDNIEAIRKLNPEAFAQAKLLFGEIEQARKLGLENRLDRIETGRPTGRAGKETYNIGDDSVTFIRAGEEIIIKNVQDLEKLNPNIPAKEYSIIVKRIEDNMSSKFKTDLDAATDLDDILTAATYYKGGKVSGATSFDANDLDMLMRRARELDIDTNSNVFVSNVDELLDSRTRKYFGEQRKVDADAVAASRAKNATNIDELSATGIDKKSSIYITQKEKIVKEAAEEFTNSLRNVREGELTPNTLKEFYTRRNTKVGEEVPLSAEDISLMSRATGTKTPTGDNIPEYQRLEELRDILFTSWAKVDNTAYRNLENRIKQKKKEFDNDQAVLTKKEQDALHKQSMAEFEQAWLTKSVESISPGDSVKINALVDNISTSVTTKRSIEALRDLSKKVSLEDVATKKKIEDLIKKKISTVIDIEKSLVVMSIKRQVAAGKIIQSNVYKIKGTEFVNTLESTLEVAIRANPEVLLENIRLYNLNSPQLLDTNTLKRLNNMVEEIEIVLDLQYAAKNGISKIFIPRGTKNSTKELYQSVLAKYADIIDTDITSGSFNFASDRAIMPPIRESRKAKKSKEEIDQAYDNYTNRLEKSNLSDQQKLKYQKEIQDSKERVAQLTLEGKLADAAKEAEKAKAISNKMETDIAKVDSILRVEEAKRNTITAKAKANQAKAEVDIIKKEAKIAELNKKIEKENISTENKSKLIKERTEAQQELSKSRQDLQDATPLPGTIKPLTLQELKTTTARMANKEQDGDYFFIDKAVKERIGESVAENIPLTKRFDDLKTTQGETVSLNSYDVDLERANRILEGYLSKKESVSIDRLDADGDFASFSQVDSIQLAIEKEGLQSFVNTVKTSKLKKADKEAIKNDLQEAFADIIAIRGQLGPKDRSGIYKDPNLQLIDDISDIILNI